MNYVKKISLLILTTVLSLSTLNGQSIKKIPWDNDFTYESSININFKLLALDFEANLKEMEIEGKTKKKSDKIAEYNLSVNYETSLTDPDSSFAEGKARRQYSNFVLNRAEGIFGDSDIELKIKDKLNTYWKNDFIKDINDKLSKIFHTEVDFEFPDVKENKEGNMQTECVFSSEFISQKFGEFLNKELKDLKMLENKEYNIAWKRPSNDNIPLDIIETKVSNQLLGKAKTALQREFYMLFCPEIYKEFLAVGKNHTIDASLLKDFINSPLPIDFNGKLKVVCEELKNEELAIKTTETLKGVKVKNVNGLRIKIESGIMGLSLTKKKSKIIDKVLASFMPINSKTSQEETQEESMSYVDFAAPENICEVCLDESNRLVFAYLKIAKHLTKDSGISTEDDLKITKLDFSLELSYLQKKK